MRMPVAGWGRYVKRCLTSGAAALAGIGGLPPGEAVAESAAKSAALAVTASPSAANRSLSSGPAACVPELSDGARQQSVRTWRRPGQPVVEAERLPLDASHLVEWQHLNPFDIRHLRDEPGDAADIRRIVRQARNQHIAHPHRLAQGGEALREGNRGSHAAAGDQPPAPRNPDVSSAVCTPIPRAPRKILRVNSICASGSPPEMVSPPFIARNAGAKAAAWRVALVNPIAAAVDLPIHARLAGGSRSGKPHTGESQPGGLWPCALPANLSLAVASVRRQILALAVCGLVWPARPQASPPSRRWHPRLQTRQHGANSVSCSLAAPRCFSR